MNYSALAPQEVVTNTVAALATNGIESMIVEKGSDALEKIKTLIPKGASVMNGASRTLEQIGFIEYLKSGQHSWNNLHAAVIAEKDKKTSDTPQARSAFRLLSWECSRTRREW